ncbi:multidrug efflux MFS transporter [Nocardioides sp. ChNu-153]|uniref:MDR family MFS transporter n=1 Tax=unclassified Nocardioides TaxID=2615069 RepID=UPI0024053DED|nr:MULTISPECIES: MDR family MFS transporter [unclassified Nocardioides]MDF9714957.1 DHA2 family efflux MFS transporter permease subunit [Nocardioides sp. ChNu-99]MDN7122446.1 multidrug efflux MFS transporter [Nocardioides sp. ChNu-153]
MTQSHALETSAVATEAEAGLARHDLVVIGVLLVASFVVILNETVMSVALPVLQTELGVAPSTGQWLTTAFLLTMGVVIPLTGFLIQRLGTRPLFGLAMSLFSVGTAIAASAPGFGVLLLARVVQASGTAIMLPLLMTTVMTIVPPARRGVMMGNISIVIAVAPALGPTVSGLVLDHLGWRWVFGLVLPIALTALVVGLRMVRSVAPTSKASVDLVSVPLAVLGSGGLVYGLVGLGHAAEGSDQAVPVALPFVVGAVALAAFVARQLVLAREDRALLDLRVFSSYQFCVAMLAMLVAMAAMLGTLILVPYFAQTVLGYGPTRTGLITLPGGLLMGLAGPLVGRVYDARGPRVLLVPGTILVSAALWMLTAVDEQTTMGWLVGANMVLCLGLAATFTPLMTSGLGAVRPELYAHGSAVLGTFQQVAGAAGTALFVTVMTVVATRSAEDGASAAAATTDGVHTAFLVGAFVSLLLVAIAPLVRKPAAAPQGVVAGH